MTAIKVPLIVRISLRDDWRNKKEDFENKLSIILGVPWAFNYDTHGLYQLAIDSGSSCEDAIKRPGVMYAQYSQGVLDNMQNFVNTYGEDGKTELNTLASAHEIILIPDNEEKYDSGGLCDIVDGKLRLFFRKSELGYWVTYCSREIDNAVNTASKTISPISFIARNSIKTSWDSQIKTLRQKFQTMLQLPEIIFDPNFGANFVEINKLGTRAPSDWEKSFGQVALNYFERLYEIMEKAGYGSDDMMREAFTMTVEMNKVSLRATEHLVHKSCNELHIAEGVLYIQTTPDNWGYWVGDLGCNQELEALL